MDLVHTYIFINDQILSKIRLSKCNTFIEDNKNNKLLSLVNIPTNIFLYKIQLNTIKSTINNLKVLVTVDYLKLKELIKNNKFIPQKKYLINIIKRNVCEKYSVPNTINEINLKNLCINKISLMRDNYIKIKELIINTETYEFFITNGNDSNIFSETKNICIINSVPNINLLAHPVFKKDNSIIIFNKNSSNLVNYYLRSHKNYLMITTIFELEQFLKTIKSKKLSKSVNTINTKKILIRSELYIEFSKLNKLSNLLNNYWNNLILFDLNHSIQDLLELKKINYKSLLVINHTNTISYKSYFKLVTNNKCTENIKKFNSSIITIKNNNIVYTKKNFNKYNYKYDISKKIMDNLIKNLNTKNTNLYDSIPENIYNFIKINDDNISPKFYDKIYKQKSECSICLEKIKKKNLIVTECEHVFCNNCLFQNFKCSDKCPLCRRDINKTKLYKFNIKYSNKLEYIQKNIKNNKKILIISFYNKSIKTLNNFSNIYNINTINITKTTNVYLTNSITNYNLFLVTTKNLLLVTDFNYFDKIIFLEDNYDEFNYYKYMLIDYKNIKQKIEILSHM